MEKRFRKFTCGCRRRGRGCSPKLIASMCHLGQSDGGYHPSARERIAGKRVARAWIRAIDLEDVEV